MEPVEAKVERNIEKLEAQLKVWNAKVAELIAKGKTAGQEAKFESRKRIDEVKAKLEVAQANLAEFKKAGIDQWDNFRAGIESAWKQAEAAFKKLMN
jgi:multidrug resistance efflux pump